MLCLRYYCSHELGGSGLYMNTAQCFSSRLAVLKVCVSAIRSLLMTEIKPGLHFVQILNYNLLNKEINFFKMQCSLFSLEALCLV